MLGGVEGHRRKERNSDEVRDNKDAVRVREDYVKGGKRNSSQKETGMGRMRTIARRGRKNNVEDGVWEAFM